MAFGAAGVYFTDPNALNTFMRLVPGDYDPGSHGVNFAKTVKDVSAIPLINRTGSLQYNEFRSRSTQVLEDRLCRSGFPVIVGVNLGPDEDGNIVPHHFVLVTGKTGNHFEILDPGHPTNTTLANYGNIFETRGYISDPDGDRSSLHLSLNDAELFITDPMGRRTGFDPTFPDHIREDIPESSYSRDGLENDETGETPKQSEIGHFLNVNQPLPGSYKVTVTGVELA